MGETENKTELNSEKHKTGTEFRETLNGMKF